MNIRNKSLFIIIQARMTSERLPGKVLLPLCSSTVLETMIQRLNKYTNHIIIATTNDGSEKPIIDLCKILNIKYYQGSTKNVLSRYYEAAKAFDVKDNDTIVRLTSDCPFIDQIILEDMLQQFSASSYDYYSNIFQRTFPRGLDTEIFTFKTLQIAFKYARTAFEKEHVTTYIHTTHQSQFHIGSYTDTQNNSKFRITLDEPDDYKAITAIYRALKCQTDFNYLQLLTVLNKNPSFYELNAHIGQKEQ